MKLVALVHPSATVTVEGAGIGVEELRAAVLDQAPIDHELAQLLVGSGRVDGNLTGTGTFQSTQTSQIEDEGPDYARARAALDEPLTPIRSLAHCSSIHENDPTPLRISLLRRTPE